MTSTASPSAPSVAPGPIVVGIDGSDEAVHALAWAAELAAGRNLEIEVIATWLFPAVSIELPSSGRVLHRHALEMARHAVNLVVSDRREAGIVLPVIHIEAYLSHPAERLIQASAGASMLVVGRGQHAVLGSTSRSVTQHATCPVAVIPAPQDNAAANSLSTRLAAEHPKVARAVEAVAQHLSAMGI